MKHFHLQIRLFTNESKFREFTLQPISWRFIMTLTKFIKLLIAGALLLASLGFAPQAFAKSDCGTSITVVRGDTLRGIAYRCDTTVSALMRANPQIKNANLIFPGQVLVLPGAILPGDGSYDIYVVQRGDTLNKLAARFNTTLAQLLKLNPDITNVNVIYEGQRLAFPTVIIPDTGAGGVYYVRQGDTLQKIAARYDTTVEAILKINPQIANPSLIFPGQRIVIPQSPINYIVQRGDTLKEIAYRFNTTLATLLELNPGITNPDLIYVGQVIRIR